ncbi:hypothetical protein NDU88_000947 [Pleurodeles waltl]|uniref:Uncharacterized protein n=1 Tax=Pleurodeles waltl TaxID=8319 RepID=A0AAV7P2E7_PLEWA|nr:hypothetical protein NDU88_000947 [Pleurodeles waltl]
MEGPSVDLFLEDLILNTLRSKRLSNFFLVERAHRAPIPPQRPGVPRTIIARIFNHHSAILQTAHAHDDLHHKNAVIKFFPDYTFQVQKQRRSFDEVETAL